MRRCGPIVLALYLVLVPVSSVAGADVPGDRAAELLQAEQWAEAEAAYRDRLIAAPADSGAWLGVGRALRGAGDAAGATLAFDQALEHGAAEAMFELARTCAVAGDPEGAVRWLHQMAESGSTARLAARNATEFSEIRETPSFQSALEALSPCRAPEFRQFDFWLGDWDVVNQAAADRPPSHNRISRSQDGCVVVEEYETPDGYTGVSLSYYDGRDEQWHQTWIDNQGQPIVHSGRWVEGRLILVDSSDEQRISRTTWSPYEGGRVRQHWEATENGGASWSTVFDGIYARRPRQKERLEARDATDNALLSRLLRRIVGEYEGQDGQWAFDYSGVSMVMVTDEEWDRLRIIAPIIEVGQLNDEQLRLLLEANFDRALDAKYAIWRDGIWATFVHPLSDLSKDHLISAMRQVAALHRNFGGSYSSTDVVFGGDN